MPLSHLKRGGFWSARPFAVTTYVTAFFTHSLKTYTGTKTMLFMYSVPILKESVL